MKITGWDAYVESVTLLEELTNLMRLELPSDRFPHPKQSQARLALLAYSHMMEMSAHYDLLANLLRLRLGQRYSIEPLAHLNGTRTRKVRGIDIQTKVFANPSAKINEIKKLAKKAGVPEVGEALEETYNGKIRNAVFHSDYAISNDHFVLFSEVVLSKKKGVQTQVIELDELGELTRDAFAFHSALIILWKRQRRLFIDFKGKFLPYDFHYKGVIEFTFEDDSLNGFRVYWPNGTTCACMRDADGNSITQNVRFRPDGSVDFFVGVLASRPGPFSPCVEQGRDPEYAVVPGTDKRPHWPSDLKAYAL
jgi:hypothetical protein